MKLYTQIIINFYFAEPQFCDEYLKTKRFIKIKGYQSQKLYTTNDIPMGKNTLTSELKRNKQLMNKSNPSTYMKITKKNFNLNEHNPVIHL